MLFVQSTHRSTKRVGQGRKSGGRYSSSCGEPKIAVSCRGGQKKGLAQADDDLSKHNNAKTTIASSSSRISDPVSDQDETARSYDGGLRAPFVQDPESSATKRKLSAI